MPDLFTLFPTPVYRVNLSNHKEFKEKSVPKLIELFKKGIPYLKLAYKLRK